MEIAGDGGANEILEGILDGILDGMVRLLLRGGEVDANEGES